MDNLKGKTAFVTGGASGIGLGVAKAAAKEGMNVAIIDLRQDAIDEALKFFEENNYPAAGFKLDVSNREDYAKVVDAVIAKFGKIHFLMNNAGIGGASGPLWAVSAKDTDFALRINIVGILNGIQAIVPKMIEQGEGGYIASTASKAGLIPVPGCGLYNLTKQAVIGITETLASDLPEGINAGVLCPGPFTTNLGMSGMQVQAELLGEPIPERRMPPPRPAPTDGEAPAAPPPPPPNFQMPKWREPEEAGARVMRAVKRGDIYILTHVEFKEGFKARADAILRAFPEDEPDENFKNTMRMLVYNPVFDKQTQVPAYVPEA